MELDSEGTVPATVQFSVWMEALLSFSLGCVICICVCVCVCMHVYRHFLSPIPTSFIKLREKRFYNLSHLFQDRCQEILFPSCPKLPCSSLSLSRWGWQGVWDLLQGPQGNWLGCFGRNAYFQFAASKHTLSLPEVLNDAAFGGRV